jgi:hypothetical protein
MPLSFDGAGTITGLQVGGLPDGTVDLDTLAAASVNNAKLAAGTPDAAALPSGTVLQIVTNNFTDVFSISSGEDTFVDVTGFSGVLNPIASGNKVLVMCQVGRAGAANNGGRLTNFRLTKNGTGFAVPPAAGSRQLASFSCISTDTPYNNGGGVIFMDSTDGTTTVNYQVQMMNQAGGETTRINTAGNDNDSSDAPYARTVSSITLIEIAG